MKLRINLLVIGILISIIACKHENFSKQKESDKVEINTSLHEDSTNTIEPKIEVKNSGSKDETSGISEYRQHLEKLIDNPINLIEFRKKHSDCQSTEFAVKDYHYKPNTKLNGKLWYFNEFYYQDDPDANYMISYKYGESDYSWNDTSEILIELSLSSEFSIPFTEGYGITGTVLTEPYDEPDYKFENGFIYKKENKVLIFYFVDTRVKRIRYIRLDENFTDILNLIEE